jgi:hypothetical protein
VYARPIEETTEILERLARLRDQQVIDAHEFEHLKEELMAGAR